MPTPSATSDKQPALASLFGRLWLAWKGKDELHLMSSADGVNFGDEKAST
jgi:hypothetical protein